MSKDRTSATLLWTQMARRSTTDWHRLGKDVLVFEESAKERASEFLAAYDQVAANHARSWQKVVELNQRHLERLALEVRNSEIHLRSSKDWTLAAAEVDQQEPAEAVSFSECKERSAVRVGRFTFAFAELVAPTRITDEEIGDALEVLERLSRSGAPSWRLYLKIATTYFWLAVNVVRELSSAITGKKRA